MQFIKVRLRIRYINSLEESTPYSSELMLNARTPTRIRFLAAVVFLLVHSWEEEKADRAKASSFRPLFPK